MSFLPRIKYGINSSRNPDAIPAKAGNYKGMDSCFHGNWIPHQVRNDNYTKEEN
jgi:hypothetical protein